MLFLTFGNTVIQIAEQELVQRTYITAETLPTTQNIEIINKNKFAIIVLNKDNKTFVVYIVTLNMNSNIYLF